MPDSTAVRATKSHRMYIHKSVPAISSPSLLLPTMFFGTFLSGPLVEKEVYSGILIAVEAATDAPNDKNLDLDSLHSC